MNGTLITFEGIDFCGKSVQIEKLVERLKANDIQFKLFREPGGTVIAEKIREALLTIEAETMSPLTEYLLYSAARAQVVKENILPALQQGLLVILDRFYDSSTAYQGYGRKINLEFVHHLNHIATQGLVPKVTFFIDIDLDEMERRKIRLKSKLDRMEQETKTFFENVRHGYLQIIRQEPERFSVIDGSSTIDIIAEEIWHKVNQLL